MRSVNFNAPRCPQVHILFPEKQAGVGIQTATINGLPAVEHSMNHITKGSKL